MNRFHQGFANLFVGDLDYLRNSGHQVSALDFHGLDLVAWVGGTYSDFDQLGGALTNQQIVFALDVLDYRFVHFVAGHTYRAGENDACQRNYGDFGGPSADIDNHVSGRFGDWQAGTNRRGHWLLDQVNLARP